MGINSAFKGLIKSIELLPTDDHISRLFSVEHEQDSR
jgi:hypothetical protein